MFGYKYRSYETSFERDLECITNNYIWSSSINDLNDPFESTFKIDRFKEQVDLLSEVFEGIPNNSSASDFQILPEKFSTMSSEICNKIGIFSLSTKYDSELLWAHYGNSHKGFCIEYDIEKLVSSFGYPKVFKFPVRYSDTIPDIELKDILSIEENYNFILKIAGVKSKAWEYEQEYRILTDIKGKNPYHFDALKSISFGLRMNESNRLKIMEKLKGRGIKYYEIVHPEKSFSLKRIPINDPFGMHVTYFNQIPTSISSDEIIPIRIAGNSYNYNPFLKRGSIKIQLGSKIPLEVIVAFAPIIKEQVFNTGDRVYIFYYLENQDINDFAWVTSHIVNGQMEVKIVNEFV